MCYYALFNADFQSKVACVHGLFFGLGKCCSGGVWRQWYVACTERPRGAQEQTGLGAPTTGAGQLCNCGRAEHDGIGLRRCHPQYGPLGALPMVFALTILGWCHAIDAAQHLWNCLQEDFKVCPKRNFLLVTAIKTYAI